MGPIRVRSGREITIRPIGPDDGSHLQAAYQRLSPESKYRRFLAIKPELSARELRYFVDVDGADHVALLATPPDRPTFILGVARYVRLPDDPHAAEFSVVVGDPFQAEGIGVALLEALARAAVAHGIERFTATMLAENVASHRLLRRLGGPVARERKRGAVDEVEIGLAA
jgi:RimJ/RimL family protein N-acetyltransferase